MNSVFLIISICSFYLTFVLSSTCPNDEWSDWSKCQGCFRTQRQTCKSNTDIYNEIQCVIGNIYFIDKIIIKLNLNLNFQSLIF